MPTSQAAQRPSSPAPADSFASLGVPRPLVAALTERGISSPRPIQALTLPDALAGADVLGRAETGSGKTLAFGLPMLARLAAAASRRLPRKPHALVLVPTRELAAQVHDALAPLAATLNLKTLAVYGGAPIRPQVRALQRGTDVVVATPGRLTDLIKQGACVLDVVSVTVLDEADHMSDMGFLPAVRWLLDRVPAGGQRLLFSATLDRDVDTIVRAYLTNPVHHSVVAPKASPALMDHQFQQVTTEGKVEAAAALVKGHRRVLMFVRTKRGATRLVRQLGRAGVAAAELHGNLAQNARQRALASFASGAVPVLVATDIAARGIHVDDIELVVHYDPPEEAKAYLHRSGRTARAGAAGTVVTLVLPDQTAQVERLRRGAGLLPPRAERPAKGSGSRPRSGGRQAQPERPRQRRRGRRRAAA